MRGFNFSILALLVFSSCLAYSNADYLLIKYGGYNNIEVVHESSRAQLLGINQSVYVYPLDALIVSSDLKNLSLVGDHLVFRREGDFSSSGWLFNFTINNSRRFAFINVNPVFPYPVSDLPFDVMDYLRFDSVIDSNIEIKSRADEVVSGVSDYLSAVLRLSEFVNKYVNYSFFDSYVKGTLPASIVYSQARGVCDEFAVLFMSLARNVGIPCRYVTGYSFGNVLGLNSFGPHAWVEVYVPFHGWISVDPTYGEHGWLDASHVSVVKAWNVTGNYLLTSTVGYYLDELNLSNNLPSFMTSSFGSESSGFSVINVVNESLSFNASLSLTKSEVASGEYFMLTVSVVNPTGYFIPLSYDVVTTSDVVFVNASSKRVLLLKPHAVTDSFTIFKAPTVKGKNYIYVHPISVYIPGAGFFNLNVTVNPSLDSSTSLDELVISSREASVIVNDLVFKDLRASPNVTYSNSSVLMFSLLNKGNSVLHDLVVNVYGDNVVNSSLPVSLLGINELRNFTIPLSVTGNGVGSVRVYVSGVDFTVSNSTVLASAFNPELSVVYDGVFVFNANPSFRINVSNPYHVSIPVLNLSVVTSRDGLVRSFNPGSNDLVIDSEFPVEWLDFGSNTVVFSASYIDEFGTLFTSSDSVRMERKGEWYELIIDYVMNLIDSVVKLFNGLIS